MNLYKIILIIFIVAFSNTDVYAASNKIDSSSYDLKMTLKNVADYMLNKNDKDGGYITAISLTTQCGMNSPVSVFAGTRGIDDLTPITEKSIFQIGSITKTFVSLVILQLAEENNINIDDVSVIRKWFPEYPNWGNISLRQLMNMTSGIPGNGNQLSDDIFKRFTAKEYFNKISPDKILNLTYKLPLHFKPGTQYEYSNTNYTLLGRLIKKVTHHAPEVEISNRISKPLGLRNTHYVIDKIDEAPNLDKEQLVHGYAFQTKASHPYPFMPYGADTLHFSLSYANTSGAMVSTPLDINTFLHSIFDKHGLFNKYQKQLITLVSRQTGQPIKSPAINDRQGFGLGVIGFYWNQEHPLIYVYNGATDGFNFAYLVDPKKQIYLTVAINSRADLLGLDDALKLFEKIDNHCG